MDADSKRTKRLWLFGVIATMGLTLGGPTRAYAQQSVAQTLRDTFQLHGYVENQEIIRSEKLRKRLPRGVDPQPHRLAAFGQNKWRSDRVLALHQRRKYCQQYAFRARRQQPDLLPGPRSLPGLSLGLLRSQPSARGQAAGVWGKVDFFRLQDIVNPVDFGQHFFIEPFEDTRIPQLALWLQHRFGDVLGMQDVAGNVVWNFDEFNPVGLSVGGQPWAVNFGDQKRAFAFANGLFDAGECAGSKTPGVCNPNHVNFGLYRERVPDWRLRNSGLGMKWDFQLPHPAVRFALTDWWGIGQTPVFVESQLQVLGDPTHPGAIVSGSNNPASGVNCAKLATISSGFPGFYGPGGGGAAIIATNARSIHLAKGVNPHTFLDNCTFGAGTEIRYHKDNTLGLSADYFEPHTGVIVRVESSWTHNALLNDTDSLDWTTNNDILQYVVGIDRPHFIRFLNPDDSFFTSFQVFETYYPGAHSSNGGKDGIVTGVNDFTFTAFTQTHYYRDQIIPLIFATFGA
jgi:hypothetical protein